MYNVTALTFLNFKQSVFSQSRSEEELEANWKIRLEEILNNTQVISIKYLLKKVA